MATTSPTAPRATTARRTRRTCCRWREARRRFARCRRLLPRAQAGVAALTYSEYAPAFERAGHRVMSLDISLRRAARHAHACNRCESEQSDGRAFGRREAASPGMLNSSARGGTLLVDEAFADTDARRFARSARESRGLIVLRSSGKFFGLAGVRAGFVLAAPAAARQLAPRARRVDGQRPRASCRESGVRGPRVATADALTARRGQRASRRHVASPRHSHARHAALRMDRRRTRRGALHQALATRGVWTRLFASSGSVRFGLPATEAEWARLHESLRAAIDMIDAAGAA